MGPMLWLLLAGLGLAATSELLKRRKVRNLAEVSDEDFVKAYKAKFTAVDAVVIEERNSIARVLGLPSHKLFPDHRFDELSKYTGFTGDYELGMSQLGDELADLYERAAMKKPSPFPATVGEYIFKVSAAKGKLASGKA